MVDAYLDWKADRHTCGYSRSRGLRLLGRPDPELVAAYLECVGCEELERTRAGHAKSLEKEYERSGVNPMAWREYFVQDMAEARADFERQRQDQQARERR